MLVQQLHSPNQPSPASPQALSTPDPTLQSSRCIPPTLNEAGSELEAIKKILKPLRASGAGYKDTKLDLLLWGRLKLMKMLLVAYLDCLSRLGNCYAPQPPVNLRHWTTDHPQSDMDLALNH